MLPVGSRLRLCWYLRIAMDECRITPDELDADRKSLMGDQVKLRAELEKAEPTLGIIEPWKQAFSFAVLAASEFQQAKPERKREIASEVFSNLELKQKTLLIQAKLPYEMCSTLRANPDVCTR